MKDLFKEYKKPIEGIIGREVTRIYYMSDKEVKFDAENAHNQSIPMIVLYNYMHEVDEIIDEIETDLFESTDIEHNLSELKEKIGEMKKIASIHWDDNDPKIKVLTEAIDYYTNIREVKNMKYDLLDKLAEARQ